MPDADADADGTPTPTLFGRSDWAIDVTVGAVPFAGDMLDLAFKSNAKNLRLLTAELERWEKKAQRETARRGCVDVVELSPAKQSGSNSCALCQLGAPERR